jgi:predicted SprT family Zn-dependent metalloprotease
MKYDIPMLQAVAEQVTNDFWLKAFGIFTKSIGKRPAIIMNARLTATAGRAFYMHDFIDLSCYLMTNNMEYFKVDTIPHELCHIIAWRLYGDKGHGKGWKYVLKEMSVNGERCHTMQTKYQAERK